MPIKLYAVRDEVAQTFNPPFADSTDESAMRSFAEFVRSGKSPIAKDLALYSIGAYNTSTGVLTPNPVVTLLVRGSDIEVGKHE